MHSTASKFEQAVTASSSPQIRKYNSFIANTNEVVNKNYSSPEKSEVRRTSNNFTSSPDITAKLYQQESQLKIIIEKQENLTDANRSVVDEITSNRNILKQVLDQLTPIATAIRDLRETQTIIMSEQKELRKDVQLLSDTIKDQSVTVSSLNATLASLKMNPTQASEGTKANASSSTPLKFGFDSSQGVSPFANAGFQLPTKNASWEASQRQEQHEDEDEDYEEDYEEEDYDDEEEGEEEPPQNGFFALEGVKFCKPASEPFTFGITSSSTEPKPFHMTANENLSKPFTFGIAQEPKQPPLVFSTTATPSQPLFGIGTTKTDHNPFSFTAPNSASNLFNNTKPVSLGTTDDTFKFSFKLPEANKSLPVYDNKDDNNPAEEDNDNPEEEAKVHFEPVIPLPPKVDAVTGEELETVKFVARAKLFRFSKETKEWKERGIGEIKLLCDEKANKYRLLMRRDQVLKVCLNHYIHSDIKFQPKIGKDEISAKQFIWTAMDFSEEDASAETFTIRFKNSDIGSQFLSVIESCQSNLNDSNASNTSNVSDKTLNASHSLSKSGHDSGIDNEADIVFIDEVKPSIDLVQKATDLKLSPYFFNYLTKPACEGCRGCDEDAPFPIRNCDVKENDNSAESAKQSNSSLQESTLKPFSFGFPSSATESRNSPFTFGTASNPPSNSPFKFGYSSESQQGVGITTSSKFSIFK